MGGIMIEDNLMEMKVESLGKSFIYESPNGSKMKICIAKAVDKNGTAVSAYAYDDFCDSIKIGSHVIVAKRISPIKSINWQYIIVSENLNSKSYGIIKSNKRVLV